MSETFTGTVKTFGAQKGFGFIQCAEVEGDVYFGARDLPAEVQGQDIQLKDHTVYFELIHTADGKPQAKQVQIEGIENVATIAVGGGGPVAHAAGEEMYSGEIKSFNVAKGFGFLACQVLEGDVYFQSRDVPTHLQGAPLVGMSATFSVHVTPDGKNQARGMKFAPGGMGGMKGGGKADPFKGGKGPMAYGPVPAPPGAYMGMAMGKGAAYGASAGKGWGPPPGAYGPYGDPFGKGGPYGGGGAYGGGFKGDMKGGCGGAYGGFKGDMKGGFAAPPPMMGGGPPEGATVVGTIKNCDPNKGYGFIVVPGIQGDVYFKLEGMEVEAGMKVSFSMKWMRDGKPQARDLVPALAGGEVLVGAIKTYSEKNGYGFLTCEGSPQDIYFQKRSLPEELQAGTRESLEGLSVQFSVEVKPDGKPQAHDLQQVDGGSLVDSAAQSRGFKRPAGDMNGGTQIIPAKYPRLPAAPQASIQPSSAKGGCKGGGKGLAGWSKGGMGFGGGAAAAGAAAGGETAEGCIKSFNSAKGFGFIESHSVQGDVYFKGTMLPPHLQNTPDNLLGAQVQFQVRYTPDGKPQAGSIQVEGM